MFDFHVNLEVLFGFNKIGGNSTPSALNYNKLNNISYMKTVQISFDVSLRWEKIELAFGLIIK